MYVVVTKYICIPSEGYNEICFCNFYYYEEEICFHFFVNFRSYTGTDHCYDVSVTGISFSDMLDFPHSFHMGGSGGRDK